MITAAISESGTKKTKEIYTLFLKLFLQFWFLFLCDEIKSAERAGKEIFGSFNDDFFSVFLLSTHGKTRSGCAGTRIFLSLPTFDTRQTRSGCADTWTFLSLVYVFTVMIM